MVHVLSKIASFPVDTLSNRSHNEKVCIFAAAAILGTCWGVGKFHFWKLRQKTKRAVAEERKLLKEGKEDLFSKLTNNKVLVTQMSSLVDHS